MFLFAVCVCLSVCLCVCWSVCLCVYFQCLSMPSNSFQFILSYKMAKFYCLQTLQLFQRVLRVQRLGSLSTSQHQHQRQQGRTVQQTATREASKEAGANVRRQSHQKRRQNRAAQSDSISAGSFSRAANDTFHGQGFQPQQQQQQQH